MSHRLRFLTIVTILAPVLVAGCTASGVPRFVKISPDSSRVVYEDSRYGRVYALDPATGQRHVLRGTVACVDAGVERMVLVRPADLHYQWAQSAPPWLVVLGHDAPAESRLPSLPRVSIGRFTVLEFGPDPDEISAAMYASTYINSVNTPIAVYRLKLKGAGAAEHSAGVAEQWTAIEPDAAGYGPLTSKQVTAPGGIWDNGHVYCPPGEMAEYGVPGRAPGGDVEQSGTGRNPMYVLCSPDRRYVVRIGDIDDPWRRVTLSEAGTEKKEIILDKDDAAADAVNGFLFVVTLPVTLALQPLLGLLAAD